MGCIYTQKNAFAKRYGSVKLTSLTGTPTPYAIRERGGGLVPHPPRKEKNGVKPGHIGGRISEKMPF